MLLLKLAKVFTQERVPYTLVGGYALGLHGIVRATVDIDLVVSLKEEHLQRAEAILNHLGLVSRIPVRSKDIALFHEEYRTQRNLIAWSFVDPGDPTRQVDLLIFPPLQSLKTELISVHGVKIRVASKLSLLQMKRASNRPEDQLDIKRLEEAISNEKNG